MLKKCAGMQDKFMLAGKQISKNNFSLDEIEFSNTVLDNNGRILAGDITLNLYMNLAYESLYCKEALNELKILIKGIELTQG